MIPFPTASVLSALLALTLLVTGASPAEQSTSEGPAYGPELQGFSYPFPVQTYDFQSQRQPLHMAYMDVKPDHPNGHTAVLLHGKLFCAATWEETIKVLSASGYRVIALDQIGFCKSSKPVAYQFTFRQLAQNTHELLDHLGIARAIIIGHSTGGMLAAYYALLYPDATQQLVMVDPVGLEDWSAKGVPPISVEQWYAHDRETTADSIRRYQTATFYANRWEARYEPWVQMLAGMYRGPGRAEVSWDSALLYDMILTEPVIYRFGQIKVPTLLMIGDRDNTAIGKEYAAPDVRVRLGQYSELGKAAAAAIPNAQLVEFPDLGQAPQLSDPDAFHKALLNGLAVR